MLTAKGSLTYDPFKVTLDRITLKAYNQKIPNC